MHSRLPDSFSLKRIFKYLLFSVLAFLLLALLVIAILAYREAETSAYQARYLSRLAGELRYEVKNGRNPGLRIRQAGPYDVRLGYSRLPAMIKRLEQNGFEVSAQARISPRMQELIDRGLFAPYREKAQAGLSIFDANGEVLYQARSPARIYKRFEAVPPLLVESLLFIENRELLDPEHAKKNPAVEWLRLGQAVIDKAIQTIRPDHDVPGGSTLATQIEKYRHSPDGLTLTVEDKLQQMASASVRAYLEGENTLPARKAIVVSYLDTVPLAAVSGFGEVNGLGDALWAWYDLDFDQVNRTLLGWPANKANLAEVASAYKHALSLMIAQRRPSDYLAGDHKTLAALTDSYLRVLARDGIIPTDLKDAALKAKLHFRSGAMTEENGGFASRKAANAVRVRLASLLGLSRLYELDRMDLSVNTTLDKDLQQKVTEILRKLKDPAYAQAAGLYGERLLGAADPGRIIYSFTLHELTPEGTKLRIQADNYDQPFDINQGTKLDLGSTAKLRTLVTYLEIVEKLQQQYAAATPEELRQVVVAPGDPINRWAIDYLLQGGDKSLVAMLDAALERKYSADPGELFFTGGGAQYFKNFKHEDDGKVMSLREATRNSVNLVFIRLMRDIERYYMFHIPGSSANILKDIDDPLRETYLKRFADKEGKEFIGRFYLKYRGKTAQEVNDLFYAGLRPTPRRLAAAYRYINPDKSPAQFAAFMETRLPSFRSSGSPAMQSLYDAYAPGKYGLADQGYIAHVHPLELWLVRYLTAHPGAHYKDVIQASGEERIAVYGWLLNTGRKNVQDNRIRNLLEVEAFLEIHRSWQRLGYPFASLVPSLATAIGSSADRPAALADLMGIILNNGIKVPTTLIEGMHFAAGTPFEAVIRKPAAKGERMFSPELASAVRGVLVDVVERGTAARLAHAIVQEDGTQVPIGGKTGTGDHRYVTFSSAGVIKESRTVNRSATFVFFMGDRFFGTLTAFVPGASAADYKFTSGLSAQILKFLLPTLKPLTDTARPLPEQIRQERKHEKKDSKAEPSGDEAIDATQPSEPVE
ncbi:MAG: transglycosylase domain-containing protein [Sulfurimicrobium sp.]|nr:transglycosylase domain-containing protein [Sulfurimicrobium sp.]